MLVRLIQKELLVPKVFQDLRPLVQDFRELVLGSWEGQLVDIGPRDGKDSNIETWRDYQCSMDSEKKDTLLGKKYFFLTRLKLFNFLLLSVYFSSIK